MVPPTILLVEARTDVREMLAESLFHHGFCVLNAHTAPLALELSLSNPQPIDVLVADVVTIQNQGHDFLNVVRTRHPNLRVLLVSGYDQYHLLAKNPTLLEDAEFLPKSFRPSTLAKRIVAMLHRRNQLRISADSASLAHETEIDDPSLRKAESSPISPEFAVSRVPEGPMTVLFLDLDSVLVATVEAGLTLRGFDLLPAESVKDALIAGLAHSGPIHALIADPYTFYVAGMNVAAIFEQRYPEIETLFISAEDRGTVAASFPSAEDEHRFLSKSFSLTQLEAKIIGLFLRPVARAKFLEEGNAQNAKAKSPHKRCSANRRPTG